MRISLPNLFELPPSSWRPIPTSPQSTTPKPHKSPKHLNPNGSPSLFPHRPNHPLETNRPSSVDRRYLWGSRLVSAQSATKTCTEHPQSNLKVKTLQSRDHRSKFLFPKNIRKVYKENKHNIILVFAQ
jgi:hypothetical protein